MFNKFELYGAGLSVFFMGLAIYLVQVNSVFLNVGSVAQQGQAIEAKPGIVIVADTDNKVDAQQEAIVNAVDSNGNLTNMVIDDVKIGTGDEAVNGSTVVVHYTGKLQSGEEFDSSKGRGVPFEFKIGEGRVIEGWEKGLLGMKVGGERILVIPPEMGYGAQGIGPIPGNATLVFSIELLEIK